MSFPKLATSPALSTSTSKQSLRRPSSRPHSINQVAQPQPTDTPDHPSPHIGANTDSYQAEQDDHAQPYHESPSLSLPHILSQPFFTLIEDTHTSEYYHPTVHYIFSDDDTDIVTEAALRSLEPEHDVDPNIKSKGKSKVATQHPAAGSEEQDPEEHYEEASQERKESLLPDPIPGVRDNYIILDMDHIPPAPKDGYPEGASPESQAQVQAQGQTSEDQPHPQGHLTITSAHSLSPSWQVLNTQLLPAPTFENNSSGEKPANGGLMLQVQGTSGLPTGTLGRDKEQGSQRLEEMMDQFARRMEELKLVIENGERGMPTEFEGSLHDPSALGELDTEGAPGVDREVREEVHGPEAVPEGQ
ncbi:uncharacterized protein DSM5745_03767 [Aspergillus mulundensis]|uniref:Uncharacterized protein n=1 Tax=Aspergillus mulundensis TaxID=1810919 RepID=A0A3D8SLB0_9EURO|nr:hypothetical protein DSM5745_03767 [Aspergillus mulundensis]RDW87125.1 hypothetical protein DSM5745_03767 [Aspergillus mulundensis]